MLRKFGISAVALSAAAVLCVAAPSQVLATQFADYSAVPGKQVNIKWTNSDAGSPSGTLSTLPGTAPVYFSFLLGGTVDDFVNLPADFTLSGTSTTAATVSGGNVIQTGIGGTFSFVYTGPTFTIDAGDGAFSGMVVDAGDVLLTGTFSNAQITGVNGSKSGTVLADLKTQGPVTFSSPWLVFGTGNEDFSLSLAGIKLPLHVPTPGSHTLRSFTAGSTGIYDADNVTGGGGGVPEPAAWAMMLLGFGAVGVAMRRRSEKAVSVA